MKEVSYNKIFVPHIVLLFLLSALSLLSQFHWINLRQALSHLLLIGVLISLIPVLQRTDLYDIFFYCFLGHLLLVSSDFLRLLGLIEGTSVSDRMGIGYAGIGTKMTLANHGSGLVFGIISGLMIIPQLRRKSYMLAGLVILCLPFSFASILLSQSRSSLVAISVGVLPFSLYWIISEKKLKRRHKIILISSLLIVQFLLIGLLISFLASLRIQTVEYRIQGYLAAISTIAKNPLGIGWGAWRDMLFMPLGLHNMILNYFVALGLPGGFLVTLLLLLGFTFYVVGVSGIKRRVDSSYLYYLHGSFGIFLGALAEGMFAPQTPSKWINLSIVLIATAAQGRVLPSLNLRPCPGGDFIKELS